MKYIGLFILYTIVGSLAAMVFRIVINAFGDQPLFADIEESFANGLVFGAVYAAVILIVGRKRAGKKA